MRSCSHACMQQPQHSNWGCCQTHPVVYCSLLLVADPPRLLPCLAGIHLHTHTRGWHAGAGVLQAVPAAPTPRGQQAALPPGLWSQPAAAATAGRGPSVACTDSAVHMAAAGCKQTGKVAGSSGFCLLRLWMAAAGNPGSSMQQESPSNQCLAARMQQCPGPPAIRCHLPTQQLTTMFACPLHRCWCC
jgi:hypothetical protein